MPLHPAAQTLLDQLAAAPPLHTLTVEQARDLAVRLSTSSTPVEPVGRVADRRIRRDDGEVSIRLYTPAGPGPFPIYVYFHGGGWVIGNLDTEDASCRKICNSAQCVVASVNYRHAPEYRFPTAVHDAYHATCWIANNATTFNGDALRLAVGGTSAGGNLAAVVSLLAREHGGPGICYQVLITPVTDGSMETASHREYATGYGLERETMRWFQRLYWQTSHDGEHEHASPLRARDLGGLPPALIITAQYDPLRDEGKAYADRLLAAGVNVTYRCYEGMFHLYLGPESLTAVAERLREAFAEGE